MVGNHLHSNLTIFYIDTTDVLVLALLVVLAEVVKSLKTQFWAPLKEINGMCWLIKCSFNE